MHPTLTIQLPNEIILAIFHHIRHDLATLHPFLLASRRYHSLAEPFIYADVKLSDARRVPQLQLFAETISSKPQLARYVHTLNIVDTAKSHAMFPHLVNLRRLALNTNTTHPSRTPLNPNFQLTHFRWHHISYADPAEIIGFLELQPSLQHLFLVSYYLTNALNGTAYSLSVDALPSLRTLVTTPELAVHLLPGRQVETLHLVFLYSNGLEGSSYPSVKSLSCSAPMIECINHFPNLKYLQLDRTDIYTQSAIEDVFTVLQTSDVPQVEYISFLCRGSSVSKGRGSPHSRLKEIDSLKTITKLRIVDVVLTWGSQCPEFFRYSLSPKSTTVVVIDREQGTLLDWHPWWYYCNIESP